LDSQGAEVNVMDRLSRPVAASLIQDRHREATTRLRVAVSAQPDEDRVVPNPGTSMHRTRIERVILPALAAVALSVKRAR
jgi:hypothetical protein